MVLSTSPDHTTSCGQAGFVGVVRTGCTAGTIGTEPPAPYCDSRRPHCRTRQLTPIAARISPARRFGRDGVRSEKVARIESAIQAFFLGAERWHSHYGECRRALSRVCKDTSGYSRHDSDALVVRLESVPYCRTIVARQLFSGRELGCTRLLSSHPRFSHHVEAWSGLA